jgi:hypothetical protein
MIVAIKNLSIFYLAQHVSIAKHSSFPFGGINKDEQLQRLKTGIMERQEIKKIPANPFLLSVC